MGIRGRARRVGLAASTALALVAVRPRRPRDEHPGDHHRGRLRRRQALLPARGRERRDGQRVVGPGGGPTARPAQSAQDDLIQLGSRPGLRRIAGAGERERERRPVTSTSRRSAGGSAGFLTIDGCRGRRRPAHASSTPRTSTGSSTCRPVNTPAIEIREMTLRNGNAPGGELGRRRDPVADDDAQFALTHGTDREQRRTPLGRWHRRTSTAPAGMDMDIDTGRVLGQRRGGRRRRPLGRRPRGLPAPRRSDAAPSSPTTRDQMGGGIYIKSDGDTDDEPVVQLINSTLSGNTADVAGGGDRPSRSACGGTLWHALLDDRRQQHPGRGPGRRHLHRRRGRRVHPLHGDDPRRATRPPGRPPTATTRPSSGQPPSRAGPTACFPDGHDRTTRCSAPLSYNATGDQTTRTHALGAGSPAIDRDPVRRAAGDDGRRGRRPARRRPADRRRAATRAPSRPRCSRPRRRERHRDAGDPD